MVLVPIVISMSISFELWSGIRNDFDINRKCCWLYTMVKSGMIPAKDCADCVYSHEIWQALKRSMCHRCGSLVNGSRRIRSTASDPLNSEGNRSGASNKAWEDQQSIRTRSLEIRSMGTQSMRTPFKPYMQQKRWRSRNGFENFSGLIIGRQVVRTPNIQAGATNVYSPHSPSNQMFDEIYGAAHMCMFQQL